MKFYERHLYFTEDHLSLPSLRKLLLLLLRRRRRRAARAAAAALLGAALRLPEAGLDAPVQMARGLFARQRVECRLQLLRVLLAEGLLHRFRQRLEDLDRVETSGAEALILRDLDVPAKGRERASEPDGGGRGAVSR